jgi:hypothetical protein
VETRGTITLIKNELLNPDLSMGPITQKKKIKKYISITIRDKKKSDNVANEYYFNLKPRPS